MGGQGNCPTCKGTHPECSSCPNDNAARDSNYDQAKAKAERKACWYNHCFKAKEKCTGIGHITQHQVEALSKDGKAQYEKAKAEYQKGAASRKKDKKGKGGGGKAHFKTFGEGGGQEEALGEISEDSKAATALKLMAKLQPLTEGEKTKKTYIWNDTLLEYEEFEIVDPRDDEEDEDPERWTQKDLEEAEEALHEHMYGP